MRRVALHAREDVGEDDDDDDEEEEEDEDGAPLYDDEGGLATMVSKLAGVDGQPVTMHRVVGVEAKSRGAASSSVTTPRVAAQTSGCPTRTTAPRSFFTSHETAELRGCGEAGKDGGQGGASLPPRGLRASPAPSPRGDPRCGVDPGRRYRTETDRGTARAVFNDKRRMMMMMMTAMRVNGARHRRRAERNTQRRHQTGVGSRGR